MKYIIRDEEFNLLFLRERASSRKEDDDGNLNFQCVFFLNGQI